MPLKEQLEKEIATAKAKLAIAEKYPNLEEVSSRWGRKYLRSDQVNSICNEVMIYHSCGCCEDAAVIASPYIIIEGMDVFSNPHQLFIGFKDYDTFDYPDDNWESKCRDANISEIVIEEIRRHFEKEEEGRSALPDETDDDSEF